MTVEEIILKGEREENIRYILKVSKYLNMSTCLEEIGVPYSTYSNAKSKNFVIMSDETIRFIASGLSDICSSLDWFA